MRGNASPPVQPRVGEYMSSMASLCVGVWERHSSVQALDLAGPDLRRCGWGPCDERGLAGDESGIKLAAAPRPPLRLPPGGPAEPAAAVPSAAAGPPAILVAPSAPPAGVGLLSGVDSSATSSMVEAKPSSAEGASGEGER